MTTIHVPRRTRDRSASETARLCTSGLAGLHRWLRGRSGGRAGTGTAEGAAARSGAAFAEFVAIGYDKTRLISLLDELEQRALILREPDPHDRRARTIALTQAGVRLHATTQRDIHAVEDKLLDALDITERQALQAALSRLDQHPDSPFDPPHPGEGSAIGDERGTRLSYTAAAVAVAAVACDFPRDGAWLQTISTAI